MTQSDMLRAAETLTDAIEEVPFSPALIEVLMIAESYSVMCRALAESGVTVTTQPIVRKRLIQKRRSILAALARLE